MLQENYDRQQKGWDRACHAGRSGRKDTHLQRKKKTLFVSIYLSSLTVANLSDTPRRRLVVTGDSSRIQDENTESSAWFFNVIGV